MFATVSLPIAAYASLPPSEFKLLVMLSRYANRAGECSPSLRQLAIDTCSSKTAASRGMAALEERGCIARERASNGERYVYTIAKRFLPVWPSQMSIEGVPISEPNTVPKAERPSVENSAAPVPKSEPTVPQRGTQEVSLLSKKLKNARAHAREGDRDQRRAEDWVSTRFWLRDGTWGPPPDQPGCTIPPDLVAWCLAAAAEKRSALVARIAPARSGRSESLHSRSEVAAGAGSDLATGLPTKRQFHAMRGSKWAPLSSFWPALSRRAGNRCPI